MIKINIFYLNKDLQQCAKDHCDKHVVKMILEYAQILSFAHHHYKSHFNIFVYKQTHKNHPCMKWIIKSSANYNWLYMLWINLCSEYTQRYNKTHKSYINLQKFLKYNPCIKGRLTDLPQCMPDKYKIKNNPIQAYRNYYINEKYNIAKWKINKPYWFKEVR